MRCFFPHIFYAERQQVICDYIKILKLDTLYELLQLFVVDMGVMHMIGF